MKIKVQLNKEYEIEPYRSKQEKDMLIMQSFDVTDIDMYLSFLGFEHVQELSPVEKKVLLWKYREISQGGEVNIRYTCDCGQVVETQLDSTGFCTPGQSNPGVRRLSVPVSDDNLHEFVELSREELDSLDLDEYETLFSMVKRTQNRYNFTRSVKCPSCQRERKFDMSSDEYIIDSLSDENLNSMYRVYSHLSYFGNYTKADIDDMYPFERTIFVGLLHGIKKELNNA